MSDVSISSPEDLYMPESERPAYFSTVSSIPQGDQPWKAREEFRSIAPLPSENFEGEKAWKQDGLQQKQLFEKEKALLPEASLLSTDREHEDDAFQASPEDFFADDEFTEEEEQTPQTYFPLLPFPEQRVDQRAPVHELPYKSNREMLLPPALHLPFPQSDGRLLATDELGFEINQRPHQIMPIKMRSNSVYTQLKEAMEKINIRFGIQPGDLKLLNQFSSQGARILDPKLCDQLTQSLSIITPDGIFNNRKTAQGAKIAYILRSLGCTLLDNGGFDIESIKKAVLMALLLPSSQSYPNDYAALLIQNLLRNNPVQMVSWIAQLIQFGSVRVHGNLGFPLCNNVAIERLDNVLVDLCGLSLSAYLGYETEAFSLNPTQAFSKLGYAVACRQIPFAEYLQQDKGVNASTIDRALAFCVIQGLNHYLKALRELNDSQKASLLQKYSPDAFLMCFAIGRGRGHVLNVKVHPYLQELFREKIQNHDFSNFLPSEVLSSLQARNTSENLCGECGPVLFDILCRAVNLKDIVVAIVYPNIEDMVTLGFAKEYIPVKVVVEDITSDDTHDTIKQQAATQENVAGIREKLTEINQQITDIAKIVKSWLGFIKVGADRYQEFDKECQDHPPASRWEKFWRGLFAMAGLTGKEHSEKDKEGDGAKKSEQTAKNADAEKSPEAEAEKDDKNPKNLEQASGEPKADKELKKNKNINKGNPKTLPSEAPRKRGRPRKIK